MSAAIVVNSQSCQYCYIDLDVNDHRSNLALTATFVNATNTRYGLSSKDLRELGGSEISRLHDLMISDHEWSCKLPSNKDGTKTTTIVTDLPPHGSRVVFKLYWDVAPMACENFATLCTNGGNSLDVAVSGGERRPTTARPAPVGESGKGLTYRNSHIHRVVKNFVIQGGDFVFGNGTGGESIYGGGKKFKDERPGLLLKHDRAGLLSMGNSGKNSNSSQFFVTLNAASKCDGKHVIFGEVISGMEVLRHVEGCAAAASSDDGRGVCVDERPIVPVVITDCGSFLPLVTPGGGSWYDRPDVESYAGVVPEFVVRPRVAILAPNAVVAERFRAALGPHASTLLVPVDDLVVVGDGDNEEEVEAAARATLEPLMENFALDVIVAAPACARLMSSMDVPSSWHDAMRKINVRSSSFVVPDRESVFIKARPADVIDAILRHSWVGTMRPGWMLSASFV
ncbi:hypothetical protein ACHAXA_003853 [Cyclostephanos tholiformis]|uniref:PPIase cyclophilin-type domain-containing protein n=1 Tax=Cyclostephanos tholiformis TaxID=382380 RepID=A0ABD3RWU5_9STRA